ncbi:MAG: site-specific integrase [Gemmataceae bacterium]|nr:site-specific integrase [Gemmataceae bacterium]
MASLSTDKTGNRVIPFVAGDGKRRTIRLGKVSKKTAEGVELRVEYLQSAATSRLPLDGETARWVADIGDDLAAVGLIPVRQSETLGAFLDGYLTRRRADAKGGTVTNLVAAANDVRRFFGGGCPLREIDERRADEFRTHYLTRAPKLAAVTVARRLNTVKQFFDFARRTKYVPANPFADMSAPGLIPEARRHYVSAADDRRVLAACNPTWRVIVALSRFAGLRNPSEVLSLKWEHVNFETGRMTVPNPKTEHHPGKDYRVVPIFPDLRPVLEEAWEVAAPVTCTSAAGRRGTGTGPRPTGRAGG